MTIIFKEEIDKFANKSFKMMSSILEENKNYFHNGKFCEFEKFIINLNKQNSNNTLNEYILSLFFDAEIKSAGSFRQLLKLINSSNSTLNIANIRYPNVNDINWLFNNFNLSNKYQKLLFDAIELAGFNGKIVVQQTKKDFNYVEKTNGYVFNITNVTSLFNGFFVKPKIICIDGFIESESEIHSILETSHSVKESLIIVCRGMSDDVINTLVVNWKRGTLKAVPIIVPFDLMGINMLNDISVVCNCDVVSSLKGQIISAIKYTDIAYVDSIDVSNNKISITNKNNQQNVKLHIESLRNKRNESIDDIAHLYDERIKSLLGSMVIVNLSDDILYLRDRQRIDNVLRAFSQMLEFGIAELDSKEKILVSTVKTVNDYLPIIKNRLNELGVIIEN